MGSGKIYLHICLLPIVWWSMHDGAYCNRIGMATMVSVSRVNYFDDGSMLLPGGATSRPDPTCPVRPKGGV